MSVYRFRLIKAVKGQNVQVKWAEENPDGSWDNHQLTSEDPARPELYEALGAFADRMAEAHRIQRDDEHEVAIVGMHYQRDKDGYLTGVIFEARVQLTESTWWSVKSVNLAASDKQDGGPLNEVEHEAGLYINGSRAQMALEFGRGPVVEAIQDLKDHLAESGTTMTIITGDRSVTMGQAEQESQPV